MNTVGGGVQLGPVLQGRDFVVQLPRAVEPSLSGLRAPSTAFTGRDEAVEELLGLLAPGGGPGSVLVTAVAGMAGVGKTELALYTAAAALASPGWFSGGVLFADLNGYDPDPERRATAGQALDGWLRALGVPGEHLPQAEQDRSAMFRSALSGYAAQGRRILLVIDNASGEDQVRPLLPADGVTAVLVTSRHSLDIDARRHALDVLDADASVGLIRRVLQQTHGEDDRRVDDDPATARRLAELCAGLPLALRIVAALLADSPHRPLAAMVEALADEHTRLARLARADRAVRAAFDLSYRNLTSDQGRLFRLLPVNSGPDLSTEAAAQLTGDPDPYVAEESLTGLARAHLVEQGEVWGRWRMHDLLRLHADHHGRTHADSDQRDTALARLLDYYLSTARAAETHLDPLSEASRSPVFAGRGQALAWLDAEHANLTAAATTAPQGHRIRTDMAFALARYFDFRRRFDDWINLTTQALTAHRQSGDRHNEAGALNNLGAALRQVRRFHEAVDAHTAAADIYRETGDRHGEGTALNNLGLALRQVRRFHEAVDAHTAAADIYRELGDRHSEGMALNNLGLALRQARRFQEAVDAHTAAAGIYRETGDRHGEGTALNNLGVALLEVRRFQEAIDAHAQDLAICREAGDRHGEGGALNNLGLALQAVRRFQEAIDAHTAAVGIFRETGDRHREGSALNNLGNALQKVRRFDEAIDAHAQDLAICREAGDRHGEAGALNNLGVALLEVRRFQEAVDAHNRDLAICRELGDRHGEGTALNNLALALRRMRRFDDAIDAFTTAAGIFRQTGDRHSEDTARTSCAITFNERWKRQQSTVVQPKLGAVPHVGSDEETR